MLGHRDLYILFAVALVPVIGMFSIAPVEQDLAYHQFADTRTFAAITNAYNILSNIPFMFIGALGIRLISLKQSSGVFGELASIYRAFFIGVLLTGIGSAYYHWHPDNASLVWDRLPMTVAFMAFFSAVVGECIAPRLARRLLAPLLLLGVFSVLYWYLTELQGRGDLRLYILVQFLPMLLLPLILWLYHPASNGANYFWGIIGVYALSKAAELFDAQIYASLGFLSGHALKHLLAAGGTFIFYWFVRNKIYSRRQQ